MNKIIKSKMEAEQDLRDSFNSCEFGECEKPAKQGTCFCGTHLKEVIATNKKQMEKNLGRDVRI